MVSVVVIAPVKIRGSPAGQGVPVGGRGVGVVLRGTGVNEGVGLSGRHGERYVPMSVLEEKVSGPAEPAAQPTPSGSTVTAWKMLTMFGLRLVGALQVLPFQRKMTASVCPCQSS